MAEKFLLISELYPSQLKDLSSQGMTISAQEIDKVLEKAKSWSYMIKKNLEELGHTANVLLTNRAFYEHADSDYELNIYALIKERLSREKPHYLSRMLIYNASLFRFTRTPSGWIEGLRLGFML